MEKTGGIPPPVSLGTHIRLERPIRPVGKKLNSMKLVSTKTNPNCQREKNDGYQRRNEFNQNPQAH
jgi:hypothetical protein